MKYLKQALTHLALSILISVGLTAIFCGKSCLTDLNNFLAGVTYGAVLSFGLWEGNGLLSDLLTKLFPWEKKTITRLVLGVSSSVIFSGLYVAVLYYVFFVKILGNSEEWYWRDIGANIAIALLITAIISLFLHARTFLGAWRKEALRAEQLQKVQAQSHLQSLRDQLNPHFLFNSLNVLTSIVHKDPDEAERFIKKLSDIYRYVLDKANQETVELEEELDFIQSYLQLLQHRFGKNLQVEWNPPVGGHWSIPPLSLQLLVENAVKHNIISSKKPLRLSIDGAEDGFLIVRNTIQEKSSKTASSGVGLENISARFAALGTARPETQKAEGYFEVRLPLLRVA